MIVKLLKYPTDEDWAFAKQCALVTIGKEMKTAPDVETLHPPGAAQPDPDTTVCVLLGGRAVLGEYASGPPRPRTAVYPQPAQCDRQDEYDRNAARQDAPVDMIWYMNAEELMTVMEKRLCGMAAYETWKVADEISDIVISKCPEFKGLLAPKCAKYGICDEMKPCEEGRRLQGGRDSGD